MFGLGFSEILMIAVIAVLFLGPDKLPDALKQIAKLIKTTKKSVNDIKSSIEDEIKVDELKQEAMEYKKSFEKSKKDMESKLSLDDFGDFENKEVSQSIKDMEDTNEDKPKKELKNKKKSEDK